MNFFERWFKRSYDRIGGNGFQSLIPTNAHSKAPTVTVRSSLNLSPIYTAIKIKSETIAGLRFSVFERKKDGSIVEAYDHPVWSLLNVAPSDLYNAFTFKETVQASIDLNGNAFIEIKRLAGQVIELIFHPITSVEMLISDMKIVYYRITEGKTSRILFFDDVIHVPSMAVFDGLFGISPILCNAQSLAFTQSARDTGISFFSGGANLSGVLTPTGILTPEQKKNIRDEWDSKYSGVANVGKVAILTGGMQYTPISINPIDAGLIDAMKHGIEEAARIYRIPLHMMSSLERATHSNIEHQGIEFVQHCILASVRRIEYEFNRKLFLTETNRKKYFVRFDIDSLLRGDLAAKSEFLSSMFNIGAISQNEIRMNYLNMNSIGPEGDKYYVQLNMGQPVTNKNKDDRK